MVHAFNGKRQKVDFLIGDSLGLEPYELYQVSVSLEDERTRKREVGSLEAAMSATKLNMGTIITLSEEGTLECEAGRIDLVPAWKWFLK